MSTSRRDLLRRAAIIASTSAFELKAQTPVGPLAHQPGPIVYLDYDQAELDAAYDQAAYAPNMAQIQRRNEILSELTRARIGSPKRVQYGATAVEQLDIFRPRAGATQTPAPIHIFIHGGAWRGGAAKNCAYLVEPYLAAGAVVVIPDFAWVQNVGGNLMVLADQVQRSVAWVYKNASTFGADRERIHVTGHSSGAHLAACAITTDWSLHEIPGTIIKTALLVSGIYDLKVPRLSSRREYVTFDDATVENLSPQRHLPRIKIPLTIAHASLDTPEFQRQSREFAEALKAGGKLSDLIVGENYNHFELPETLANPYGILGRTVFELMKLAVR